MLGLKLLQQSQRLGITIGQVFDVAHKLRIGLFTKHHDGDIGLILIAAIDREDSFTAGGFGLLGYACKDGFGTWKVGIGQIATALPRNRPPTRLFGDAICPFACHQDGLAGVERQNAVILEQHQRFLHSLTGDSPMLWRAQKRIFPTQFPGRRGWQIKQSIADFNAQDPAHGIIQTLLRDFAAVDCRLGIGQKLFPVLRHHEDVEACVDRFWAVLIGTARDTAMAVPITNDQAVKAHFDFEQFGEIRLTAVHLLAIDAAERGHDRLRTRL